MGRGLGATSAATLFHPKAMERVRAASQSMAERDPVTLAQDESYWREIQQAFSVSRSLINLNNGGVCPSPRVVTEALVRYLWEQEEAPVYTMWRVLEPRRELVRSRLAQSFACEPEEVALVRNASEAMEILLMGYDLRSGDEVLTTEHDYPRMLTTLEQRRRREGIEIKMIPVPILPQNLDELTEGFRRAITAKTKLILISHMVNITGQIFPVKAICDLARERGIEVMVDGAHSFAQFDFGLSELGCDYFGTSLHKWLLAPKGTGLLYVRRDKIRKIWPLMAAPEKMDDDIRKFEEIGTHSAAPEVATGEALSFHDTIGAKKKEERLRYLKDYWVKKVRMLPRARLHTSLAPEMSCAIATVQVDGVDTQELSDHLWNEHHIIVAPIRRDDFTGIRVTPNLYTTLDELDYFCDVMEEIATRGLPEPA